MLTASTNILQQATNTHFANSPYLKMHTRETEHCITQISVYHKSGTFCLKQRIHLYESTGILDVKT